jgi:hypothetical protein
MKITKEVASLQKLSVKDLQARYSEAFGEETHGHHKTWLIKRIAWRLQAVAEGDLSERARRRAAELANDADLRLSPPRVPAAAPTLERTETAVLRTRANDRVPIPGTVISRTYKGKSLQVKVLPHGFEFDGEVFKSLSAVAKAITGSHCSGHFFFRLAKEPRQ